MKGSASPRNEQHNKYGLVAFLKPTADFSVSFMPEKFDLHFPYLLKNHIYKRFVSSSSRLSNQKPLT